MHVIPACCFLCPWNISTLSGHVELSGRCVQARMTERERRGERVLSPVEHSIEMGVSCAETWRKIEVNSPCWRDRKREGERSKRIFGEWGTVSLCCAEILLYLKISIRRGSAPRGALLSFRCVRCTRCRRRDLSRRRQACSTYLMISVCVCVREHR